MRLTFMMRLDAVFVQIGFFFCCVQMHAHQKAHLNAFCEKEEPLRNASRENIDNNRVQLHSESIYNRHLQFKHIDNISDVVTNVY